MKQNKKNLVAALVLSMFIMAAGYANAAETASQTVTATLSTFRTVTANGGVTTSTINESGALTADFSPAFLISTNQATTQALTMQASVAVDGGTTVNAFSGDETTQYITLGHLVTLPTAAAITDAQSSSPVAANNALAITYPVTTPTSTPGVLEYSWNNSTQYYNVNLTKSGETETSLVIPAGAAKANTFSGADAAGDYQATVTLSFT